MNNARRKTIEQIRTELERFDEIRRNLIEQIETVRDEEQEAFDAMPESLQSAERGERMQAAIDALTNAHDDLDAFDVEAINAGLDEAAE